MRSKCIIYNKKKENQSFRRQQSVPNRSLTFTVMVGLTLKASNKTAADDISIF